jgi:SAM-dependent methyltransferase
MSDEPVDAGRAAATAWVGELKQHGYDHAQQLSRVEIDRLLRRPSRTWRRILPRVRLPERAEVFEAGCGGAVQLVQLAGQGYRGVGIDVSPEVLERARAFVAAAQASPLWDGNVELVQGDFMDYCSDRRFDLVFHFGVVEHILDPQPRLAFLRHMVELARSGGWIVSVVPSGTHPLRQEQRRKGWGGYVVPEIDYSPSLMLEEFRSLGLVGGVVLPHNLFGYLTVPPDLGRISRTWRRVAYLAAQAIHGPAAGVLGRHAYSLIGIARKP